MCVCVIVSLDRECVVIVLDLHRHKQTTGHFDFVLPTNRRYCYEILQTTHAISINTPLIINTVDRGIYLFYYGILVDRLYWLVGRPPRHDRVK